MPLFKRAYRGLYGNRMIGFGNQVSFAENKTRRSWKPNVQMKTLFSETLQEKFKCRVTTYVLRCIRKKGGFDEYLLGTNDSEIKYPRALEFKQRIRVIQARRKEKMALEQQQLQGTGEGEGFLKKMDEKSQIEKKVEETPVITSASMGVDGKPLGDTRKSLMSRSRGLLDIL